MSSQHLMSSQLQGQHHSSSLQGQSVDKKKLFEQELKQIRAKVTFQLHLDLMAIKESYKQGHQQSNQIDNEFMINEQKQLIQFYIQRLREISQIQSQSQKAYNRQYLQQQEIVLQHTKQLSKDYNFSTLLQSQNKLISQQSSNISNFQQYLTCLVERIKHQRYFNEQQDIINYLDRQKKCFMKGQQGFRPIINKNNQQTENKYQEAKKVCQLKEKEIKSLEEIKKQLEERVKNQKQSIDKLNQQEEETYKKISSLALTLSIKTHTLKAQTLDQNNRKSRIPTRLESFYQQNMDSQNYPIPSSSQRQSTIYHSIADSSASSVDATCHIPSNTKSQIQSNIIPITFLFFLTILLCLA